MFISAKIIPSSHLRCLEMLKRCLALVLQGKHVVIVGAGKTAHDVGVTVSKVAASTTIVARRGHWMAPQLVLGEWTPR